MLFLYPLLFLVAVDTLEQFRKRSKIGTFPENFQRSTIESGLTLISISFLLYFVVNQLYNFISF